MAFPLSDKARTTVTVTNRAQSSSLLVFTDVIDTDGMIGCCDNMFVDTIAAFEVTGVDLRLDRQAISRCDTVYCTSLCMGTHV